MHWPLQYPNLKPKQKLWNEIKKAVFIKKPTIVFSSSFFHHRFFTIVFSSSFFHHRFFTIVFSSSFFHHRFSAVIIKIKDTVPTCSLLQPSWLFKFLILFKENLTNANFQKKIVVYEFGKMKI